MKGLAATAAACLGVATGLSTAIAQPEPTAPPPDVAEPVEEPIEEPYEVPADEDAIHDRDTDVEVNVDEAEPVYREGETTYREEEVIEEDQPSDYDYDYDATTVSPRVEVSPTVEYEYQEDEPNLLTPLGMSLSIGGGIQEFVDDGIGDVTDLAGMWEARLVVGTRLPVAVEVAYVGSAQSLDALGVEDDAVLLSNGIEGNLRFNFAWENLQPYVFGGAAYRHYYIDDTEFNTSAISDSDNIFEIPAGVGLAYRVERAIFDLRGTYRFAFDEDLVNPPGPELEAVDFDEGLDTWGVSLRVGFEF